MSTESGLMIIRREILIWFALVAQLGIIMSVSIYIGYRAGFWLDQVFGTRMWFTIGGTLLGVASGFYSLYRLVARMMEREATDGDDEE